MKQNLLRFLSLILLLAACSRQDAAPSFQSVNTELLAFVPDHILANEQLVLKPAEKHHFEMKAPQKCAGFPFQLKTPRVMRCQVTEPGVHEIELSVCDDAKTYCKFVKFRTKADKPKGYIASGGERKEVLQPPKHEHAGLPGFLMNKPDKALAEARAGGKLLFIDFYGIWCPPCNMLEEYVYKKKTFLDQTDGMVRVMMDADSDLSWEWKGHFKVGGYPTVIIANEKLEEIDRLVGYVPVGQVLKWVREAEKQRGTPIALLRAKYEGKTFEDVPAAARKRLGMWRYHRGEYDAAISWLKDHPDAEARKTGLAAVRRKARKEGDDAAGLEALRTLVREFPKAVEYPGWVKTLLDEDMDKTLGMKHLSSAFASIDRWAKSPKLEEAGYTLVDIQWQKASLREASGDEKGAKAAYLEAAELYKKMADRSDLKVARGASLEQAYSLHKAGENERAKKLYEKLAEAYKDEFTFNYDYAYILTKLEEYEKAYKYARLAEAHSYGDNWLRSVHLKAKLELKLGRKSQARASIEDALREAVVPRSTAVRTHTYIARLRKLLQETEAVN